MKEFKDWLNGTDRNYKTGLALYNRCKLTTKHDAFLNVENPSRLHHNMLLSVMRKLFHVLSTTNGWPKVEHEAIKDLDSSNPLEFSVQKISTKGATEAIDIHQIQGRSMDELRKDKSLVNTLLSQDFEKLSLQAREVFNNDEAYFLQKKSFFLSNADLEREMRSTHAKARALDPDPKNNEQRSELMGAIDSMEKQKQKNWKAIDSWLPPTDLSIAKNAVENERSIQKTIKKHYMYIKRALASLPSMPATTLKQQMKITKKKQEVDRRKAELESLGKPYSNS